MFNDLFRSSQPAIVLQSIDKQDYRASHSVPVYFPPLLVLISHGWPG